MQSLTIDKNSKKISFKDQNKMLIYLVRFFIVLNILNSIIFFLVFNNQDDALRWIWLVFAFLNVYLFYYFMTKFSIKDELNFNEIELVTQKAFLGIGFQLKNGKFRKVFKKCFTERITTNIKTFRSFNCKIIR